MRIVIIEDETLAANRLAKMLQETSDEMEIVKKLDSVSSAVKFLHTAEDLDLIFMDIQLADGLSFDIFEQVEVRVPVIFTTAFDQYTLKAFKVNSIDYLLKPIDEQDLKKAVSKYHRLYTKKETHFNGDIRKLLQDIEAARFMDRLLIKRGQQISYLKTESIAFCYADGKLCYTVDFNNNKYLVDKNLSQLEEQLQPRRFYRINRHFLVNIEAVRNVHNWFGGRLKVELLLPTQLDTLVSRERVQGFRKWLGE
jgi:DNA-binding LytR/AlgR family response regulator